jgi:hypothetical protein
VSGSPALCMWLRTVSLAGAEVRGDFIASIPRDTILKTASSRAVMRVQFPTRVGSSPIICFGRRAANPVAAAIAAAALAVPAGDASRDECASGQRLSLREARRQEQSEDIVKARPRLYSRRPTTAWSQEMGRENPSRPCRQSPTDCRAPRARVLVEDACALQLCLESECNGLSYGSIR